MVTSRPLAARRRCRRPRRRRAVNRRHDGRQARATRASRGAAALHERPVWPPAARRPAPPARGLTAADPEHRRAVRGRAAPRPLRATGRRCAQVVEHPPPGRAGSSRPRTRAPSWVEITTARFVVAGRHFSVARIAGDHRVLRQRAEVLRRPAASGSASLAHEPIRAGEDHRDEHDAGQRPPRARRSGAAADGRRGHAGDRDRETAQDVSSVGDRLARAEREDRERDEGEQQRVRRPPPDRHHAAGALAQRIPRRPQQHGDGDREERDAAGTCSGAAGRAGTAPRCAAAKRRSDATGIAHTSARSRRAFPRPRRAAARAPPRNRMLPARAGRTRCGSGAGTRAATATKKCSAPCAPNSGYARACAAVNTRGAPPRSPRGTSTAAAASAPASSAKPIRRTVERRAQPGRANSTPTASSAAGG